MSCSARGWIAKTSKKKQNFAREMGREGGDVVVQEAGRRRSVGMVMGLELESAMVGERRLVVEVQHCPLVVVGGARHPPRTARLLTLHHDHQLCCCCCQRETRPEARVKLVVVERDGGGGPERGRGREHVYIPSWSKHARGGRGRERGGGDE